MRLAGLSCRLDKLIVQGTDQIQIVFGDRFGHGKSVKHADDCRNTGDGEYEKQDRRSLSPQINFMGAYGTKRQAEQQSDPQFFLGVQVNGTDTCTAVIRNRRQNLIDVLIVLFSSCHAARQHN